MTALVPVRRQIPEPLQQPSRPTAGLRAKATQLLRLLLSGRARAARFALVGGVCGLLQLLLLVALKRIGLPGIPANVAAYLLSAQVNFLFSNRFIWHDRWSTHAQPHDLLQRWVSFHISIAGTFVLSQAVFIAGRLFLPDVVASAAGIGLAAVANFVVQDRLTFQQLRGGARLRT